MCHSQRSDGQLLGCRRLLREEVTSGRLDAAPSKAAVLQQLCERLKFNPEAASALHKSLYRQKVDQILEEKKKITGDLACCGFCSQTHKLQSALSLQIGINQDVDEAALQCSLSDV